MRNVSQLQYTLVQQMLTAVKQSNSRNTRIAGAQRKSPGLLTLMPSLTMIWMVRFYRQKMMDIHLRSEMVRCKVCNSEEQTE